MSKIQDSFYFQTFMDCAADSCKAAKLLKEIFSRFNAADLPEKLDEMHAIEHAADKKKHELLNQLVKAFITPIEREDILDICQNLDDMTDQIEDVLIRLYYNRVTAIRPDAEKMVDVLIACCEEVAKMMAAFPDFKKSKSIHNHIVRINTLEEEADKLYISGMYRLHGEGRDPFEVIAWREIYSELEKCMDTCEHVADTVESAIMKNT